MNYCKAISATFEKIKSMQYSKILYLVESTQEKHAVYALCNFLTLNLSHKDFETR